MNKKQKQKLFRIILQKICKNNSQSLKKNYIVKNKLEISNYGYR